MMKTREEAYALLAAHTTSRGLIKHALAVEAAMRWYARLFEEDEDLWGLTGLLHDFDYQENPHLGEGGHPFVGCAMLRQKGYPESMIEAILGHATYSGVERRTTVAQVLFAVDELTGLITASALVRPDKSIHSLTVKSVRKKMRDKSFAKAINRDDIVTGTEKLGLDLNLHIQNVIDGMRAIAEELELGRG